MHNGVYDSFDSLSLSVDEQQAIIAFMRSLTDN